MPEKPNSQAYDPHIIREDFDRIARLSDGEWDHNRAYHPYLLRHIPQRIANALDIGCGKGEFARMLGRRADRVEGIDLSPEMIAGAKRQTAEENIEYSAADIRETALPANHYDCIASIATFHHLPLRETLKQLREALAPGGVLAVLDLYKAITVWDFMLSGAAVPLNLAYSLIKTGRLPHGNTEAWRTHSAHEVILPLREIREISEDVLPGARVKRHLLWRYSLVWVKPD